MFCLDKILSKKLHFITQAVNIKFYIILGKY